MNKDTLKEILCDQVYSKMFVKKLYFLSSNNNK